MPQDLQINDLFWTLQGEGHWTGRRALFVRLPFCNYDCPWCDTEYNSYKKISDVDFINFTRQEKSRFAVITGGEPMMHKDLKRIIMLLKSEGFYIACETNGSLPIPEDIDFATVSPKKYTQKKHPDYFINEAAFQKASEFKYVVETDFDFSILDRHNQDGIPTESHSDVLITDAQQPSFPLKQKAKLSLSPEHTDMSANVSKIIEYIKIHPQWTLSLQTHKWIQIP